MMARVAVAAAALALTLTTAAAAAAAPVAAAAATAWRPTVELPPPPFRGYVTATWATDAYATAGANASVARMAALGVNVLEVVATQYVADPASTSIGITGATPSDTSLASVVAAAHAVGMAVVFKPHVDCLDGSFRGLIGTNFTASEWADWWGNYTAFIGHYAELAAATGAAGFNVGTELTATEAQEGAWRAVISFVRGAFGGVLWYGTNWYPGVYNVDWWDALDYMGVDAYAPLSATPDPSVAAVVTAWAPILANLSAAAASAGKHIVFSEIGYASFTNASMTPWECCVGTPDADTQAALFTAALAATSDLAWFAGTFWWAWNPADVVVPTPCDTNFNIYLKPAEAVLAAAYGGVVPPPLPPSPPPPSPPAPPLSVYANGNTSAADWSWGVVVDLGNTSDPYPGHTASASVTVGTGGGALSLYLSGGGVNGSAYASLVLDIRLTTPTPAADTPSLIAFLCACTSCSPAGCQGASAELANYAPAPTTCTLPTAWSTTGHITIPLPLYLPPANATILRVQLASSTPGLTFTVDNLGFQ